MYELQNVNLVTKQDIDLDININVWMFWLVWCILKSPNDMSRIVPEFYFHIYLQMLFPIFQLIILNNSRDIVNTVTFCTKSQQVHFFRIKLNFHEPISLCTLNNAVTYAFLNKCKRQLTLLFSVS